MAPGDERGRERVVFETTPAIHAGRPGSNDGNPHDGMIRSFSAWPKCRLQAFFTSNEWTHAMSIFTDCSRGLVDLIYPPLCLVCAEPCERYFCSSCHETLVRDLFPTCPRCGSTVGPHTA